MSACVLGGTKVALCTQEQLLTRIEDHLASAGKKPLVLASANLDHVYQFGHGSHRKDPSVQSDATWLTLLDGMPLEETTLRRHDRTKADRTKADGIVNFTRANGEIVECKVLDYSLSGVYLITEARPAVGEFVLISKVPGRVARHHENGIAIEFTSHEQVVVEPPRTKLFATG